MPRPLGPLQSRTCCRLNAAYSLCFELCGMDACSGSRISLTSFQMLNLEASQLGSLVTQQGWSSGGDMVRTFSSIKHQLGMLNPTLFSSFRFCYLKTCTIIPGEAKHVTTHGLGSISAIALPPHAVSPHMRPSRLRLQSRRHKAAYQIHSGLHVFFSL